MKLLIETSEYVNPQIIEEDTGEKKYYIDGVFMQSDVQNKNGRIYPKPVLQKEVNKYIKEKVESKRSLGELEHPQEPRINLDRVSHLIKEMKFQGTDVYGKALILDTPCGNIVKGLMKENVSLGVSSRGIGSIIQKEGNSIVGNDFSLACCDIVQDPSAPSAFVNNIMESVDWIWDEKTNSFMQKMYEENGTKETTIENKELEELKFKLNILKEYCDGISDDYEELFSKYKNLNSKLLTLEKQNNMEKLVESVKSIIEKNALLLSNKEKEKQNLLLFQSFLKNI